MVINHIPFLTFIIPKPDGDIYDNIGATRIQEVLIDEWYKE